MRVRFQRELIFAGVLFVLCAASEASAAEGKWGLGGFVDYNIPFRSLRDRFSNAPKYGGTLSYVRSQSVTAEIEFHHSKFDKGKPAAQPFVWPVDKKTYTSPKGQSTMTFNSLVINTLVFPGDENKSHGFQAKDYRYYIVVGGGFYRYKAVNKDLVYPAQTKAPINFDIVMEPQVDQRYTLAIDLGMGVEAFVTDNLSLDVRARYNFVVGELRPTLFYNLDRTWPIQLFDFGVGMKFYFWR